MSGSFAERDLKTNINRTDFCEHLFMSGFENVFQYMYGFASECSLHCVERLPQGVEDPQNALSVYVIPHKRAL